MQEGTRGGVGGVGVGVVVGFERTLICTNTIQEYEYLYDEKRIKLIVEHERPLDK